MNEQIKARAMKEILLEQLQLIQEACEMDMTPEEEALLSEAMAKVLDAASALARMIAERMEHTVELKLDEQFLSQAVLGAIRDNPVIPPR